MAAWIRGHGNYAAGGTDTLMRGHILWPDMGVDGCRRIGRAEVSRWQVRRGRSCIGHDASLARGQIPSEGRGGPDQCGDEQHQRIADDFHDPLP